MSTPADDDVTIGRSELHIAATVISGRFREPSAERQRLALVDELLRLESNLGRALADHARHALSESRGTHSTWDVAADSADVYVALQRYAEVLHRIAARYRSLAASARASDTGPTTDRNEDGPKS